MRALLPIGLAALAFPAFASPVTACIPIAIACLGGSFDCHPSELERAERDRRQTAETTRLALAEARRRLRSGEVDVALELAELLVPNVRPIETRFSDCGPEGEVDYGEGRETEESLLRAMTAGTALAGRDPDDLLGLIRPEDDWSFGAPCNAEFRRAFAGHLRRALAPDELRRAWLFLGPRRQETDYFGYSYGRLVRFETRVRTPPMRWQLANRWLRAEVARARRLTAWGRSLDRAIDAFWAERAPHLADDEAVCPAAVARWAKVRERVLAALIEKDARRRAPR